MLAPLFMLSALAAASMAASFQEVKNFGTNPSNATMFIYVPDILPPNPAVIVGVHWCHGSAEAFFNGTSYSSTAEQLGYIVVYPNAPSVALATGDGCWDVSSNSTLTRFGGGDSFAIYEMTEYTIRKYHADRARVFVTGVSSGAMMTNVLLATYPDVYKAGSAFAGVAFGCFADPQGPPDTWSDACATGKVIKTPQQWGAEVRNAYPEYRGIRPKIQLWHGTNDTTLYPQNLQEEIKQWTDVFRISQRPTAVQENLLQETWVGERYGEGEVEVVIETGQTHNLVVLPNEALKFFGFRIPKTISQRYT